MRASSHCRLSAIVRPAVSCLRSELCSAPFSDSSDFTRARSAAISDAMVRQSEGDPVDWALACPPPLLRESGAPLCPKLSRVGSDDLIAHCVRGKVSQTTQLHAMGAPILFSVFHPLLPRRLTQDQGYMRVQDAWGSRSRRFRRARHAWFRRSSSFQRSADATIGPEVPKGQIRSQYKTRLMH